MKKPLLSADRRAFLKSGGAIAAGLLAHPVSTVIIGCDTIAQLEENVRIAREFTPLSHTQMAALNELAAPGAEQSLFFRFTDRSKG
jgi:hypothetical protein